MSHWQVTLMSAAGQSMIFGVDAPDETSAFQFALGKVPASWTAPVAQFSVTEITPLCAQHRVRHACGDSASETPIFE